MSGRLRVLVCGMMGGTPFAGMGWQVLHYLEGFRRLGHDVYYIEDTPTWPYDPRRDAVTDDPGYAVEYIARLMAGRGLADRWAYCAAAEGRRAYGMSESDLRRLLARADVLVNLHGVTVLRDEHLRIPVRIYLETDPVRPQIEVARGDRYTIDLLGAHTHHFSFAENLGAADCGVPVGQFTYLPTRQPVVIDWWNPAAPAAVTGERATPAAFTTVANWRQNGKDIAWNGETYLWSKHAEFEKVLDLPQRVQAPLELALAGADEETIRLLRARGWRVADAVALSLDETRYRDYLAGSRGEFTVAKDQNVRLRSGWFSDRSASYLAAGRPVVTQETGFSKFLPTGAGLFAFTTVDDAVEAIGAIQDDYGSHRRAAREIAAEYFDATKVAAGLLDRAGV